jgi:hypothetical protein
MSSEQVISYVLEGLDEEVAAQIQYFDPQNIKDFIRIARNVEQGRERLTKHKNEPTSSKSKNVNAVQTHSNAQKSNQNENKNVDPVLEAVNKLSESINALTIGRNGNKNNLHKQSISNVKRNFNPNYKNPYHLNRNQNYSLNANNPKFNNNFNPNNQTNRILNNRSAYYQNNNQYKFKPKIQCYSCKRFGHKQSHCRLHVADNQETQNNSEGNPSNIENKGVNSLVYNMQSVDANTMITIDVKIQGKIYKGLIDSGSELTIIRKSVAEELSLNLIPYTGPDLEAVNKDIIRTYGKTEIELGVGNDQIYSIKTPIIVVDTLPADILLGIDVLMKLNIKIDCTKRQIFIDNRKINCLLTTSGNFNKSFKNVCVIGMQSEGQINKESNKILRGNESQNEDRMIGSNGYKNSLNQINIENKGKGCEIMKCTANVCQIDDVDLGTCVKQTSDGMCAIPSNKVLSKTGNLLTIRGSKPHNSNKTNGKREIFKGFIHCVKDLTLNPLTISCIEIKLSNGKLLFGKQILLFTENEQYFKNGLSLRNTLTKADSNTLRVQCINTSEKYINLKCGQIMGVFEVIDEKWVADVDLDFESDKHTNENKDSRKVCFTETDKNYKTCVESSFNEQYINIFGDKIRVGPHLTKEQKSQIKSLLEKFPNLISFNDEKIGRIKNFEYKIKIKDDAMPVHCSPARTSFEQMKIIDNEIKLLEEKGIIRPSKSDYCSRTVLVKRKDGRFRLCQDYRDLNKDIEKDRYPIPDIQLCLRTTRNSNYFTNLDMNNAFLQVPLAEESMKYTAFITPSGKFYEYKFVPYGTCISSAAFQRAIDLALSGMKYIDVASFIDDLIIPGETFEIHLIRLEKVLQRLDEFGFTIRAKKCGFAMDKAIFLGYLVSNKGIEPAPSLLEAINNIKIPTNITEVRAVVGLLSYPRKCIEHFSMNVEPLTRLTRKNVPFVWGKEQQIAFETIKNIYKNKPFLRFFDPNLETELRTDASLKGLAGALMQRYDNHFYPCGYFSRLLNDSEKNYPIYDLEVMAAFESMNYFK